MGYMFSLISAGFSAMSWAFWADNGNPVCLFAAIFCGACAVINLIMAATR